MAAAADAALGEEAVDIHSLDLDVNVFWKASLGFCYCRVKNYDVRANGKNRGRGSLGTSSGKAELWLIQWRRKQYWT